MRIWVRVFSLRAAAFYEKAAFSFKKGAARSFRAAAFFFRAASFSCRATAFWFRAGTFFNQAAAFAKKAAARRSEAVPVMADTEPERITGGIAKGTLDFKMGEAVHARMVERRAERESSAKPGPWHRQNRGNGSPRYLVVRRARRRKMSPDERSKSATLSSGHRLGCTGGRGRPPCCFPAAQKLPRLSRVPNCAAND